MGVLGKNDVNIHELILSLGCKIAPANGQFRRKKYSMGPFLQVCHSFQHFETVFRRGKDGPCNRYEGQTKLAYIIDISVGCPA